MMIEIKWYESIGMLIFKLVFFYCNIRIQVLL